MEKIETKGLLIKIFVPSIILSLCYFLLGHLDNVPNLLLFCILGTFILVPAELGMIMFSNKKENGTFSLKSAFDGQKNLPIWKVLIIAFIFFGIAGLLSAFVSPIETKIFATARGNVLNNLPPGFDWTNFDYMKSFSRPVLIVTCTYYRQKNLYISLFFHFFCKLFSNVGFILAVLG